MSKHPLIPGLMLLTALVLLGCESSERAARRRAHASEFAALSADEQAAVKRGALREGMNTNAVLIAWGPPSVVSTMSTPSGPFVVWEYYRNHTVTEQPAPRQLIVPWSPTPVPENRVYPLATQTRTVTSFECLERTAVFREDRLVNWSPK